MLSIGWTTLPDRENANTLATAAIETGLVTCAHIDGPLTAIYRWEGRIETATEFRVTLKFVSANGPALDTWLHQRHPYAVPQWISVQADHVAEKYLSWVHAAPNP